MWQVKSTKTLLQHPLITVLQDEILLPDGQTLDWIRLEEKGHSATVVAINEDGEVLVQKEYSYPQQQFLYDFPGGFVPDGEDITAGANRELIEEAGYRAANLTLIGRYYTNRRKSNMLQHIFLAIGLTPEKAQQDIGEDIEPLWLSEQEINQLIRDGQIMSPRFLSAWSFYQLQKPAKAN